MVDKPDMTAVQSTFDAIPEVLRAPWTAAQVEGLNLYQIMQPFHPFTCPREHVYPDVMDCPACDEDAPGQVWVGVEDHAGHKDDKYETCSMCHGIGRIKDPEWLLDESVRVQHICLVALREGWRCPGESCDYTQDWAWPWMARMVATGLLEEEEVLREEQEALDNGMPEWD